MDNNLKQSIFTQCEQYGELRTKEKLKNGSFSGKQIPIIEEWLKNKEKQKSDYLKSDELRIAKESNTISKWALGIAALSFIVSILVAIYK